MIFWKFQIYLQQSANPDGQRCKIQIIRGANGEVDPLKGLCSWGIICAVNMPEIAGFDLKLMKHVQDFPTNEIVPNGREVEKNHNGKILVISAKSDGFLKAEP